MDFSIADVASGGAGGVLGVVVTLALTWLRSWQKDAEARKAEAEARKAEADATGEVPVLDGRVATLERRLVETCVPRFDELGRPGAVASPQASALPAYHAAAGQARP